MLAIATCGVRQTNETLVATLPEGVEPEVPIWVKIHRKSGGKPERVEVALQKPAEPESPSLNYFKYTAPRAARPGLQFAVDVPLEHVKAMCGVLATPACMDCAPLPPPPPPPPVLPDV
eukprot:COSAG01_NODE_99_length_26583_cov_79.512536_24_plen_118_part_00